MEQVGQTSSSFIFNSSTADTFEIKVRVRANEDTDLFETYQTLNYTILDGYYEIGGYRFTDTSSYLDKCTIPLPVMSVGSLVHLEYKYHGAGSVILSNTGNTVRLEKDTVVGAHISFDGGSTWFLSGETFTTPSDTTINATMRLTSEQVGQIWTISNIDNGNSTAYSADMTILRVYVEDIDANILEDFLFKDQWDISPNIISERGTIGTIYEPLETNWVGDTFIPN